MTTTVIAFTILEKEKWETNKLFHFKEDTEDKLNIIIIKDKMGSLMFGFPSERYVPLQKLLLWTNVPTFTLRYISNQHFTSVVSIVNSLASDLFPIVRKSDSRDYTFLTSSLTHYLNCIA